jgi:hypothetical protein
MGGTAVKTDFVVTGTAKYTKIGDIVNCYATMSTGSKNFSFTSNNSYVRISTASYPFVLTSETMGSIGNGQIGSKGFSAVALGATNGVFIYACNTENFGVALTTLVIAFTYRAT